MNGRLCDYCGGAFTAPATAPRQRYCSLSHAAQGRKRLPWVACAMAACGVRFPQRKARQRFCSVECGRGGPRGSYRRAAA